MPERNQRKDESENVPNIGVFVCHCGSNIGGHLDVPEVARYASTLDGVVHSDHLLFSCSEDGLQSIKDAIKEHGLDRVIVASCTPRTHEPTFQRACMEAGLNKYMIDLVNIREQCSWVHMDRWADATQKAKELVRMGVTRSRLLQPLEGTTIDVRPASFILGGGIGGLSAALNLADQGFKVHLVEKDDSLGGYIKDLDTIWEGGSSQELLGPLIEKVMDHASIEIYLGAKLVKLEGQIGNFTLTVNTLDGPTVIEAGTLILATGAEELRPNGFYGYGEIENVVSLAEFERMGSKEGIKDVAFIQCVGSRGQKVSYCSRICCNVAIKTAIHLLDNMHISKNPEQAGLTHKEGPIQAPTRRRRVRSRRGEAGSSPSTHSLETGRPRVNLTIYNRTVNAYGVHHEINYNLSREKRVRYIKYDLDHLPKVSKADGKVTIRYYVEALEGWREMSVDMLVLSTPLVPHEDCEDISHLLKVPRGPSGFFLEAHVKLRPVEFATDGIYVAGTCKAPADITETILQANAAASRASIPMRKRKIVANGAVANVDPAICWGCGTCVEVCPFGAPELVTVDGKSFSKIHEALCKGCGICVVQCPVSAIHARHFTHSQIVEMIEGLSSGPEDPRCQEGAGGGSHD